MADSEEKAKQLAAAKKRVQELKKKKGGKQKKGTDVDEKPPSPAPAAESESNRASEDAAVPPEEETKDELSPISPAPVATESLAERSKARSASFRKPSISTPLSPGLFNPDGESAQEIYRKHVARIEELEKENKRLFKEAGDSEKRWKKAEEELAVLREGDADAPSEIAGGSTSETSKLRNELLALQRQNAQLQSQLARGSGGRHGSSPSISATSPPSSELEAQLQSKSATIETMELEMSRLRAQVERLSVSASTPSEQIAALEEKLARAEKAAALAQRELADLKRNLERTAEKAVRAGSELASAETKLRTLERDAADLRAARDDATSRADALDRKVATLTTLHREQDGRTQALRRDKERADKEAAALAARLEAAEAEVVRLRKRDAAEGGGDEDAVQELEDEGRRLLEKRVRELESENTDLRRGIWHERRKELQVGPDGDDGSAGAGGRFTDVDLGVGSPTHGSRRRGSQAHHHGGGLGDFFASGLNALTGTGAHHHNQHSNPGGNKHFEQDELLEDDDMDFDEDAFRKAQEEDAKKRIERIKEIKRTLSNWQGWRLDLVENRRGGGEGIGEIFEI